MPTLRSLFLRLVDRARVFLHQAGTVILAVTLVLWLLSHVPFRSTATNAGYFKMFIREEQRIWRVFARETFSCL